MTSVAQLLLILFCLFLSDGVFPGSPTWTKVILLFQHFQVVGMTDTYHYSPLILWNPVHIGGERKYATGTVGVEEKGLWQTEVWAGTWHLTFDLILWCGGVGQVQALGPWPAVMVS